MGGGCMGLHGGCMGLHGVTWGCMGLHGAAWGCARWRQLLRRRWARAAAGLTRRGHAPLPSRPAARAKSASDASLLRRKGHLKEQVRAGGRAARGGRAHPRTQQRGPRPRKDHATPFAAPQAARRASPIPLFTQTLPPPARHPRLNPRTAGSSTSATCTRPTRARRRCTRWSAGSRWGGGWGGAMDHMQGGVKRRQGGPARCRSPSLTRARLRPPPRRRPPPARRRSTGRTPGGRASSASCPPSAPSSRPSSWCARARRPRAAPRSGPLAPPLLSQARLQHLRNPSRPNPTANPPAHHTIPPAPGRRVPGVRRVLPPQPPSLHPAKLCGAAPHPQHRAGVCACGGGVAAAAEIWLVGPLRQQKAEHAAQCPLALTAAARPPTARRAPRPRCTRAPRRCG
jgi:hypothetical protein